MEESLYNIGEMQALNNITVWYHLTTMCGGISIMGLFMAAEAAASYAVDKSGPKLSLQNKTMAMD